MGWSGRLGGQSRKDRARHVSAEAKGKKLRLKRFPHKKFGDFGPSRSHCRLEGSETGVA